MASEPDRGGVSRPSASAVPHPPGGLLFAAGVVVFAASRLIALFTAPQTPASAAFTLAGVCVLVAAALPVLSNALARRAYPGRARTLGLAALGLALSLAALAPGVRA